MNMVNKLNSHLGNSTSFSSNQKKRNNNKRQSDPTPVSKDDISLTKEAKAKFQFKNNYTELNNCIEMLEKAQERVSSLGHLLQQNSEDLTITDMRYHNFKNDLLKLLRNIEDVESISPVKVNFQKFFKGPHSLDELAQHLKDGIHITKNQINLCYDDLTIYEEEILDKRQAINKVLDEITIQSKNDEDAIKHIFSDKNNSSLKTQLFSLCNNFKKLIS